MASESTTNGGGSAVLASLSDSDRATWQRTGELPNVETKAPETAEADDDEPEPAAAVEAKPAAPAAEKPVSVRQQKMNDAIRGRVEAETKAKQLEARIKELEARATPAPKPETKIDEKPDAAPAHALDPNDPEPDIEKYDDFLKFQRDSMAWAIRQNKRDEAAATKREEEKVAAAAARTDTEKRVGEWVKRRDAHAAKTAGFTEKVTPFLERLFPGTPLGDTIMDSEVGPQIADYLVDHQDVLERIQSAGPILALRELGKLEAKFDTPKEEVTSASASAGPAAKTVTTAPTPPVTLSARSADPPDPVESALKDRDFARYAREANARDLAASKR